MVNSSFPCDILCSRSSSNEDFSLRYSGVGSFIRTKASSSWYKLPCRRGEQDPPKSNAYADLDSVTSQNLQLFHSNVRRFNTKSAILRAALSFSAFLGAFTKQLGSRQETSPSRKKESRDQLYVAKIPRYLTGYAV